MMIEGVSNNELLMILQETLNELARRGERPMIRYGSVMTDGGYVLPSEMTGQWEAKFKVSGSV